MKIFRYRDTNNTLQQGIEKEGTHYFTDTENGESVLVVEDLKNVASHLLPIDVVQIIGIGLNYKKHAAECGLPEPKFPVVFTKGNNTLIADKENIELPQFMVSTKVDYEGEMAIIIKKEAKNVKKEDALDYVLGYTVANDVSARDWQLENGGGQWCRGKSFDTFTPFGPFITIEDGTFNPNNLEIKTTLNGEVVQQSNTADMIFSVEEIIEFLSASTTLPQGTVILTGTPEGVGMGQKPPRFLTEGDVVSIELEHVGTLTNTVTKEQL